MTRERLERRAARVFTRELARRSEPDRYLAALLAPRCASSDLIVLAAFVGELSRISLAVSEPMMGEVRLQWWSDALVNMRNGVATGNPIADATGALMRSRNLPEALFVSSINARSLELDTQGSLCADAVDAYLDDTDGAAFQLAGYVLKVNEQTGVQELMRAAGRAYGRVRLLRTLSHSVAARRTPAPLAGMISISRDGATAVTAPMRDTITSWLKEARRYLPTVPRAVLPAILPLALVEPYLAVLERQAWNSGRRMADISPLRRVWQLWRASVRGRI